jgi:hypothetical protein
MKGNKVITNKVVAITSTQHAQELDEERLHQSINKSKQSIIDQSEQIKKWLTMSMMA